MLLFPKTTGNKRVIEKRIGIWSVQNEEFIQTTENRVQILDFTEASLKYVVDPFFTDYVLVNDETSMRIDVIAKISMGNITNTEKMLKFNGISNPFTIDSGDLLFVPDQIMSNINMNANLNRTAEKLDIRNQYIDPEKASKIDPTLGTFEKRDKPKAADPSKTTPALPPNFANIGEKEIEIRGGKIHFGPNISQNKNECNEPISKSEFLAKLIKNRINR